MFYMIVKNSVLQLLHGASEALQNLGNLLQLLHHPFRG